MEKIYKNKSTRRLKIIAGQVRGLQKMISEDKYCINIINQSSAIKEAISSFENFVLENHLYTHVVEQMKKGEKHRAIKEILSIYKLSKRK